MMAKFNRKLSNIIKKNTCNRLLICACSVKKKIPEIWRNVAAGAQPKTVFRCVVNGSHPNYLDSNTWEMLMCSIHVSLK